MGSRRSPKSGTPMVLVRTQRKLPHKRKLRPCERTVTVVGHLSEEVIKRMKRKGISIVYRDA
jgi:hypothetical protein